MRHAAFAALTFALGTAMGAPVVYGPVEVEVVNVVGSTFAEAEAQVLDSEQACRAPSSACGTTAMPPRQLMPVSASCGSTLATPGWRRARDLNDADRYIAKLQSRATARELFDCEGSSCLVVVPTVPSDGKEKEGGASTLSVCSVQVVKSVPSPPIVCAEALKQHPRSGVLLRVALGNSSNMCSMGLRDFDAVFKGRAGDVAAVRKLVGEVLRAKPFNLTVMEEGSALVGTRAHVASELLPGWREWTTVRVDVDARG